MSLPLARPEPVERAEGEIKRGCCFGQALVCPWEKPTIAKILRTFDLLEEFGNKLGPPHSKKVKNNIFELRIRGREEIRIFYTFKSREIILVL